MLQESDIVPYHLSPPPGERVIVLAPHPDDETLGCGGTIRLLLEAKKEVKVIFLTSGDKADPDDPRSQVSRGSIEGKLTPPSPPLKLRGGLGALSPMAGENEGKRGFGDASHVTAYSLLREKEAEKALRALGVSDYEFLRFPDRELFMHYEEVRERLEGVLEAFRPDTIYSPSMAELHPDHRATAALSLEIQKAKSAGSVRGERHSASVRIVFYEVALPLRPNLLVDVTYVYRRKVKAVKKYKSQLRLKDYLRCITALNTFRSLTVEGPRYVEAFWGVDIPLNEEERGRWLCYQ